MLASLGLALALVLIFEGLMPVIAPARWRDMFRRLLELSDGQIRFFGMTSIAIGLVLLLLLS